MFSFSGNCSESWELKLPFPPQFYALDFAVIIFGHMKNKVKTPKKFESHKADFVVFAFLLFNQLFFSKYFVL